MWRIWQIVAVRKKARPKLSFFLVCAPPPVGIRAEHFVSEFAAYLLIIFGWKPTAPYCRIGFFAPNFGYETWIMESGKAPFCCTAFYYSPFQCRELHAEICPTFFFSPSNKESKPYLAKCIIYKKPTIIAPFATLTFFHVIHDEEKMLITKQTWPKVLPALSKMIKVNKEMISVHRRSFSTIDIKLPSFWKDAWRKSQYDTTYLSFWRIIDDWMFMNN